MTGFLARLGLAVVHPRWALSVADDRVHAGRSGSDLLAVILAVLAATQLHGLVQAVWLAGAVDAGLGVRAAVDVLTAALTPSLALLVIGAFALFALGGPRRSIGRAIDLACVAVLPLMFIQLAATIVLRVADVETVPIAASWALSAISYGWMGALIALAIRPARIASAPVPSPPSPLMRQARWVGRGVAAVAVAGIALQAVWVADHSDRVRPMTTGGAAPAIALPEVGPTGALGAPVTLASTRGKVTVVDFWATWCGPCLASMPRLERLARTNADVAVLTINLDDAAAARALFNQHGYTMKLLADDGDTSTRYGVSSIPHTVLIDQRGVVRQVVRGTGVDLAAAVDAIRSPAGSDRSDRSGRSE